MLDFKAKMHQIQFRLELRPRPRWGSLQHSPRSPRWIKGDASTSKGRGGEEWGKGRERKERGMEVGEWKGGRGERREGEGREVTVEPGPLRVLLRHWPPLGKKLQVLCNSRPCWLSQLKALAAMRQPFSRHGSSCASSIALTVASLKAHKKG